VTEPRLVPRKHARPRPLPRLDTQRPHCAAPDQPQPPLPSTQLHSTPLHSTPKCTGTCQVFVERFSNAQRQLLQEERDAAERDERRRRAAQQKAAHEAAAAAAAALKGRAKAAAAAARGKPDAAGGAPKPRPPGAGMPDHHPAAGEGGPTRPGALNSLLSLAQQRVEGKQQPQGHDGPVPPRPAPGGGALDHHPAAGEGGPLRPKLRPAGAGMPDHHPATGEGGPTRPGALNSLLSLAQQRVEGRPHPQMPDGPAPQLAGALPALPGAPPSTPAGSNVAPGAFGSPLPPPARANGGPPATAAAAAAGDAGGGAAIGSRLVAAAAAADPLDPAKWSLPPSGARPPPGHPPPPSGPPSSSGGSSSNFGGAPPPPGPPAAPGKAPPRVMPRPQRLALSPDSAAAAAGRDGAAPVVSASAPASPLHPGRTPRPHPQSPASGGTTPRRRVAGHLSGTRREGGLGSPGASEDAVIAREVARCVQRLVDAVVLGQLM
jgi:hypothetical protein